MSVQATGDNLLYQWKKDGINLSDDNRHHGTGTDTLHIVKVEMGDSKARYQCSVKNEIGEEFSEEAVLTVSKLIIGLHEKLKWTNVKPKTGNCLNYTKTLQNNFSVAAETLFKNWGNFVG